MTHIGVIPKDLAVGVFWPQIATLISQAMPYGRGEYTIDDIRSGIESGVMFALGIVNGGIVEFIATATISQFPRRRVLYVQYGAGRGGKRACNALIDAAIQNAQIGGNIWSSNYVAGSAGWIIDRTGYAEFRNILARGNIEATSIKADAVDIVSTLNLQGEAVFVPRIANTVTAITYESGSFGTWKDIQSCYVNAEGGFVSVLAAVSVSFGGAGASGTCALRVISPTGVVIAAASSSSAAPNPSVVMLGSSAEVGTYNLQALPNSSGTFEPGSVSVSNRTLQLLGCKKSGVSP